MKRFLVFILVIALVFSLTACGSKDGTEAVKETESLESLEEFFASQVNQPETTAPESVTGQEVSGDTEETTSAEIKQMLKNKPEKVLYISNQP